MRQKVKVLVINSWPISVKVDAIVHVVRAFDDENVMREQGREDAFVDPLADIDYH